MGWQAAYGAARVAVEIAKESSDMFLPLKAVAGALSVLIKNYDVSVSCCGPNIPSYFPCFPPQQTSDNADNLKEIERRVRSLSSVLASPISEDDYAEKGRRMELQMFVTSHTNVPWFTYPSLRKLEGVITKLEPLTEQHTLVDFLCNADHAKILTGSVKELDDAITDYQV